MVEEGPAYRILPVRFQASCRSWVVGGGGKGLKPRFRNSSASDWLAQSNVGVRRRNEQRHHLHTEPKIFRANGLWSALLLGLQHFRDCVQTMCANLCLCGAQVHWASLFLEGGVWGVEKGRCAQQLSATFSLSCIVVVNPVPWWSHSHFCPISWRAVRSGTNRVVLPLDSRDERNATCT